MNADVEKAVERGDAAAEKMGGLADWETIKQALRDQDAEIARFRGWNERVSVCRVHTVEIVDGECLVCRAEKAEALPREVGGLIPTTWLDPLLTGLDAVIHGPPYDGHDIENLLRALRDRITAHLGAQHD